jgi:hypothetical protein
MLRDRSQTQDQSSACDSWLLVVQLNSCEFCRLEDQPTEQWR